MYRYRKSNLNLLFIRINISIINPVFPLPFPYHTSTSQYTSIMLSFIRYRNLPFSDHQVAA
ncbi:MAG: hypothetical protein LBR97_00035 [Dysgonamonadaceae bacterium]|nr:hypothetical protein [Dysgonamonadaceae bacterium]